MIPAFGALTRVATQMRLAAPRWDAMRSGLPPALPGRVAAALSATSVALVLLAGCRSDEIPGYVRLDGAAPSLSSSSHPTSAVLVVFWATWCPPCRTEAPELIALAERPPPDLSIVVLGHDEDWAPVRAFFGGDPPPSLRFTLDGGKANGAAFGVASLPVSYLLVEGRLVARFDGPRRWNERPMRRLLERLVHEPSDLR